MKGKFLGRSRIIEYCRLFLFEIFLVERMGFNKFLVFIVWKINKKVKRGKRRIKEKESKKRGGWKKKV